MRVCQNDNELRQIKTKRLWQREYTQCYKSKPDRQITRDDAIRLIGREEFLSGISRTAFHWNCGRERGNRYVHFESGIVGRHINKVV